MLIKIGLDFSPIKLPTRKRKFTEKQDNHWNHMCTKLTDFKQQNGHCDVSHYEKHEEDLGKWVARQRVANDKELMDGVRKTNWMP